jgi:hypothetical protein
MSESEDVKPAQQTINLKIKEGDKPAVTFKVKRGINFSKIFDAFHNKVGAAPGTYKFMRDGSRVEPTETPDSLDMDEDEQIDAIAQQVRAYRRPAPPDFPRPPAPRPPPTPRRSQLTRAPSPPPRAQTGGAA